MSPTLSTSRHIFRTARAPALAVAAALPTTLNPLFAAPATPQQFGGSLAASDGQVLVGEVGNGTMNGIVRVFARGDEGWTETGQLSATDKVRDPDGFGRALSAGGGWLLIGSPLASGGQGKAYVFRSDGSGGWLRVAELTPQGDQAGEAAPDAPARFGASVAVGRGVAMVGAPGARDGAGTVYLFSRTEAGDWQPTGALDPDLPGGQQGFGNKLALRDGALMVGTSDQTGPRNQDPTPGLVVVYSRDGEGAWNEEARLTPARIPGGIAFGGALAVTPDYLYVGAPGLREAGGAVFVYRRGATDSADDASAWVLDSRLGPPVVSPASRFGGSVLPVDGGVLVGDPGAAGGNGAVYEYSRADSGGDWSTASVWAGSPVEGGRGGSSFGATALSEGGLMVFGATTYDNRAGAALVFESSGEHAATLESEFRSFPSLAGSEVECVDGRADAFECMDVNVTAFLPIKDLGGGRGTRVNDIWGWTDPETGREIAIVGRTDGTSFVDISDPYNPRFLGDLPATEGSRHMIWRDIKVYNDHAYVVADAALEHGVQVFDLRQLRDVGAEPVTFGETFLYDGIHSAHNIVINEASGFGYAVGNSGGGETCGGGLHMIDLREPSHPTFAGCFAAEGTGRRGTGYVHDAQCVIYHGPDSEHAGKEICFGSNETALNIADVTDKDAPVSLSTAGYPNVAYTHQGWLTEDHRYFYMNDEGDEPQGLVEGTRTLVWDVSDLDDPLLVNEYIAETTATDHNLYVVGDVMYQSNYSAGFRVLDISDPVNPLEIGFLDTSPYEGGASWSNYPFFESGIIAVTGTGDGLFLVRDMTRRRLIP